MTLVSVHFALFEKYHDIGQIIWNERTKNFQPFGNIPLEKIFSIIENYQKQSTPHTCHVLMYCYRGQNHGYGRGSEN